jgi:ribosomal protein L7Ae-like RNA K-turn-binding protein
MVNEIIKLAQAYEWFKVSENVEIAKGKYEIKKGWNPKVKSLKRRLKNLL